MHYLITGFPGTGKSTIANELKQRGHIAYDPQSMRSYMHNEDRLTGKHIHKPDNVPTGWYDEIGAYNWDPVKLSTLLAGTGDIYICSLAHNQETFYGQFNKIFLLTLDFTILIKRLELRDNKAIGKTSSELSDILRRKEEFERSLLNSGATQINVSSSVHEIVNQILQLSNE